MLDKEVTKGIYKHFKGGIYEVLYIAKNTNTLEKMIVYKSIDDKKIWIRSRKEFFDFIEFKGKKISRFKYIGDETYKNY